MRFAAPRRSRVRVMLDGQRLFARPAAASRARSSLSPCRFGLSPDAFAALAPAAFAALFASTLCFVFTTIEGARALGAGAPALRWTGHGRLHCHSRDNGAAPRRFGAPPLRRGLAYCEPAVRRGAVSRNAASSLA